MRIAATAATLLIALTACSTTESTVSPYQQPNQLMSTEINQRIDQIPYQHRDELVQNLLWLSQTGEQTIPALLTGLNNENPKVRSSCAWVLGRLRDRRTAPVLQRLVNDAETSVRMEACRSLVLMGDLQQSPKLIEGLDSDRKEVRYMCHEALKTATGHDFGYDHLNQNQQELQLAVLRWRQWWGEYAGDTFFASNYEQEHGLNNLAAPAGETRVGSEPQTPPSVPAQEAATPSSNGDAANGNASNGKAANGGTEATSTEPMETIEPASGATPGAPGASQGGASGAESSVPPSVPPVVIPAQSAQPNNGSATQVAPSKPVPVVEVPNRKVEHGGGTTGHTTGSTGNHGGN